MWIYASHPWCFPASCPVFLGQASDLDPDQDKEINKNKQINEHVLYTFDVQFLFLYISIILEHRDVYSIT